MKKWNIFRLTFILVAFSLFYLLILARLFYWQFVRAEELRRIGKLQSTESLPISAIRGEIKTSDDFPLVTNKYTYLAYVNPKQITDKNEAASQIAPIVGIDAASISAQLSKNLFWVRIATSTDEEGKGQLENLRIPGLGFQRNSMRYYPEASMAAQLVGFVGKDKEGSDHGYFGLEGYYNEQLRGRSGRLYVIRDALGNTILNDVREEQKIDGRTLILNIDRTVQFIAEKKLKEGVDKYGASEASVVIMEPGTGKVLAMVSYPRFNPQKYYEYPGSTFINPVISSLYEPGSTFKTLIMSAALDKKVVKPDTKCTICSAPVDIGEYSIKTWNGKYFPDETMTEVIQHSDNTGMVFVGKKLGLSSLIAYLRKFGIGEETKIDLQGEATGILRDESQWHTIDMATATFGQGISVTPIQLLTAVNSIANGGNLMRPYVVSKIIAEDGREITIQPQLKRRVLSETAAKVMTWMMVNAVENGEAKWVKIKDYKIAGKTGTAQIPVAGHYDPNETIASFVGFFPADKPKVSMLVLVDRPKTSIYGSETAAPIFFNIARGLINYYNIPPSY